jgi:beta-phosphoglucomutase
MNPTAPQAVIFDFDGVLVDSEPLHLACFQEVLAPRGVTLTAEAYYGRYLGFDDAEAFRQALRDAGRDAEPAELDRMIAAKTALVQRALRRDVPALPGAAELIGALAGAGVPLAVCSAALREEIRLALETLGVWGGFAAVVAAEDVQRCKPDPQGYRLSLEHLRAATGRALPAERCCACEDSPAGVRAAKAAGLRVLAVTSSYAAADLHEADAVVNDLTETTPRDLATL